TPLREPIADALDLSFPLTAVAGVIFNQSRLTLLDLTGPLLQDLDANNAGTMRAKVNGRLPRRIAEHIAGRGEQPQHGTVGRSVEIALDEGQMGLVALSFLGFDIGTGAVDGAL